MTKRRMVWVGVVTCVVLLAGLSGWYASRPHPVNRANFAKIRVGMTRAEVEALLGCPPGNYATPRASTNVPVYLGPSTADLPPWATWASNEGNGRVRFDDEDRVQEFLFGDPYALGPPGLIDRLRAWLGW